MPDGTQGERNRPGKTIHENSFNGNAAGQNPPQDCGLLHSVYSLRCTTGEMTLKLKVIQGVSLKYIVEPLSGCYLLFRNDTEAS